MALAMAWHISHHFHRPTSWLTVMVYLMTDWQVWQVWYTYIMIDSYGLPHDWLLWPTVWLTVMAYLMAECYGLPHDWKLGLPHGCQLWSTSWLTAMAYLMADCYGLLHGWQLGLPHGWQLLPALILTLHLICISKRLKVLSENRSGTWQGPNYKSNTRNNHKM